MRGLVKSIFDACYRSKTLKFNAETVGQFFLNGF